MTKIKKLRNHATLHLHCTTKNVKNVSLAPTTYGIKQPHLAYGKQSKSHSSFFGSNVGKKSRIGN